MVEQEPRCASGSSCPAAILLGVWIVYPTVYTIVRSFYDRGGSNFIGFDNYQELFTQDTLTRAIRNNVLWLAIVPAFVTAIGLVFAVLLERIRWSVAFKTVVFMPMAISLFAAGVIWRVMDEKDPDVGAVNAAIKVVADEVDPPGALSQGTALQRRPAGQPQQRTHAAAARPARRRGASSASPASPRRRCPKARCRRARRRLPPARSAASCGATSGPAAADPAWSSAGSSACPA